MASLGVSSQLRLGFLLLFVCIFKGGLTEYNEDLCKKYAPDGSDDLKTTPYFFDDFEAKTSETTYQDGQSTGKVMTKIIRYSVTHKQFEVTRAIDNNNHIYMYVDQDKNRCTFFSKDSNYDCIQGREGCAKMQENTDLLSLDNRKVSFTDSGRNLMWPTETKKKVNLGESEVRGIKSKKYVTCSYDDSRSATIVTEWHVLDVDKYKDMDSLKSIVLMANHHTSKGQDAIKSRRIDYFVYRKLSSTELQYGIPIDTKHFCHKMEFQSHEVLPNAPKRFSVLREIEERNPDNSVMNIYHQELEYNSMSQIIKVTDYQAINSNDETVSSYLYTDYSTKHAYNMSSDYMCSVSPATKDSPNMPSPKDMWVHENSRSAYTTIMRDIPCSQWFSNNGQDHFLSVFVATKDWLKSQGRKEDEFYPVTGSEFSKSSKINRYYSFYEYRSNPGYHYPFLDNCFDSDNIVLVNMVLLINYNKDVKDHRIEFEYEVRTMIKKITGIISSARVANLDASKEEQSENTFVFFMIYGDAKDIKRPNSYYDTDPVTSEEAFNKLKKAANSGKFQFDFEKRKVTVQFKKGSLKKYSLLNHKKTSSGHSAGAMAAVGLTMILIGLAASVGLVYGYKRWKQGGLPALSFTFGKEGVQSSA